MHKGADLFYKCRFQTAPAESLEDPLWTLVLQGPRLDMQKTQEHQQEHS